MAVEREQTIDPCAQGRPVEEFSLFPQVQHVLSKVDLIGQVASVQLGFVLRLDFDVRGHKSCIAQSEAEIFRYFI